MSKKTSGIIVTVAIILVSFFALKFWLNSYLTVRLEERIRDGVYNGTKGKYAIRFADLKLSFFPAHAVMTDLSLIPVKPDTMSAVLALKAKRVELNNVELLSLLFKKYLAIDEVRVLQPDVKLYSNYDLDSGYSEKKRKNLQFDSLFIQKLDLINAVVHVYFNEKDSSSLMMKENNIHVDNLRMVAAVDNKPVVFSAGSAVAVLHQLEWNAGEMYRGSISTVYMSFTDSIVRLDTLTLEPLYNKKEFAHRSGNQIDRFSVLIPEIKITKALIAQYLKSNWLKADSAYITGGNLYAYRDKNYERANQVILELQKKLANLAFKSSIEHIKVNDLDVLYEELEKGADKAGKVVINNIDADISNFTSGKKVKDTLMVNAIAVLMDGRAKVEWRFPLGAEKVLFYSEGTIEQLPLQSLNSITRTNAGIRINSGWMYRLVYSMKADHNHAHGEVHMNYDNLEVSVEPDGIGKAASALATFAANNFLINEHNLKGEDERAGKIAYPNNPQRFIFNYSWKALLTGITDIVEVKKKKR